MLDSARHFLPMSAITGMLDAMSYNKLNVLHWHITDSQSFSLLTDRTPELAFGGAYDRRLTYSTDDVRKIVSYAADRGIRVVPELDSPGHATSWAVGYPNASLPTCATLDPTADATYALLRALFEEVARLFPDEYLHIGADEVDFACWNSTKHVREWMQSHGLPLTDLGYKNLTALYIGKLAEIVSGVGKVSVAWQEAMDHYGPSLANPTPPSAKLPSNMVIEQWFEPAWNWANLTSITGSGYIARDDAWPPSLADGFEALVTLGWYLDNTAVNSWEAVYLREPLTNMSCTYSTPTTAANDEVVQEHCECTCPSGPWRDGVCHCYDHRRDAKRRAKVLGGEAPLWGEHIDESNLQPRAFPRAMAVAERLWSAMEVNNVSLATPRLGKHRCRMLERGVAVTPLGPGYC